MTVSDLIRYFGDGDRFPDPKQEVKFVFSPDGEMSSKKLDIRFATVPGKGDAIVELNPTSKRKFMFSLKFEANPVIEAHTVEEAEQKAFELMKHRAVVDICTGDGDESYVAQEPYFLEEVKA